jgi:hypothetical protein
MSEIICPHCKNPIYDEDVLLCHFCGKSLARTSGGVFGKMRGPGMNWVWIILALMIFVVLLLSI